MMTRPPIRFVATLLAAAILFAAASAHAQPQASGMPPSLADLVEKLTPAVVNISTTQKIKQHPMMQGNPFMDMPNTPEMEPFREFFERFGRGHGGEEERSVYSLGSGFIIDAGGYIITNNHVIEGAEEINVILSDDSKYKATVVGRDKKTDLALLKVKAKKDLPFVTLGDSDAMRVGDWVIAIGNPFGLGGSVTQGIISARQRSINAGPFDDFLQTDAPINRGNSGGPLFNMKGEVIGINTAIFSPSGGSIGIGFAIPTALARTVISQLKETGHTTRGWLGVKIQEVSEEIAESVGLDKPRGAMVLEVTKDSPADKAGLKVGDIITNFDGKDIAAMRFLPRMVAETPIGKKVPIAYWRDGATKSAQISVGKLDEDAEETEEAAGYSKDGRGKPKGKLNDPASEMFMGMRITPLTPQVREALNIDKDTSGVAVGDVKPSSEAFRRGMRRGDVIAEVNGQPVAEIDALKKAFEDAKAKGRKFALMKVQRRTDSAFVTLPTSLESKKESSEEDEE